MTVINRPWISSFAFDRCYDDTRLEQLHKLARNFCVSLDLGNPSSKHVESYEGKDLNQLDERDKYLLWVKNWKIVYRKVSELIRRHKLYRRTVRKIGFLPREQDVYNSRQSNLTIREYYQSLSQTHLERLQETAMVLLNARYNAKLAAGARYLRLRERNGNADPSNRSDAGSIPAEATTS
jgi:hypothetical protein